MSGFPTMSTIYTVDWTQFLRPDSELPTDVTFNVIQASGAYKGSGYKYKSLC